jgi:AGCS family alanine or glycine:cation symporter
MVIAGSLLSMPLVWQLADIIMALMAITNLTAILLLSPVVTLIASDYLRQRKLGVPPVFDPARYPDIKRSWPPARGMICRGNNSYRSIQGDFLLKSL